MSFDFKETDRDFAVPSSSNEYEGASNFPHSPHARKTLPQLPRGATKRMVVIKPKVKATTWAREAELAPIAETFKRLLEDIALKYGHQSSLQRLLFSEEYMTVIGFGPRIVPLLLADLKTGNTPWFWALKAITRENIGENVGAGDFRSLREAWLAWGVSKGLL